MAQSEHPATRIFSCDHCGGEIRIPYDLAPTAAPCPFCEEVITSPPPPVGVGGEGPVPSYGVEPGAEAAPAAPPALPEESPAKLPVEEPMVPLVEAPASEGPGLAPLVEKAEEKRGLAPELAPAGDLKPGRDAGADSGVDLGLGESERPPVLIEEIVEEKPVAEPVEQPAAESVEQPAAEPVEQPAAESVEQPAAEPVERPVEDEEKALPAAADEPVGETGDAEQGGSVVEETEGGGVPAALIVFLAVGLLLAGLVVVGVYLLRSGRKELPMKQLNRELVARNRFLREGWKPLATEQLRGFMEAGTVEEKAEFVMGGQARVEEMRAFYREEGLDEGGTPLAAFIHHSLELKDRERGLFLMRYERPAQFNIREFFRPVAPLDVQYRVEEPGLLLSSFAMLENFAMDPVRVLAFFKQEGDKLLLDWDVYVQTKYRLLKEFSTLPRPGENRVFRVLIQEDIPDYLFSDPSQVRYYRVSDPAHPEDYVKVPVAASGDLGQTLSVLNWIGVVVNQPPKLTATVVLEWSGGGEPMLRMKEFLCWEFLGLGGKPGQAPILPEPQPEAGGGGDSGAADAAPAPASGGKAATVPQP